MRSYLHGIIDSIFGAKAPPEAAPPEPEQALTLRIQIDPASNPQSARGRFEARAREEKADRELRDLAARVQKLEATPRQAPPMPHSEPGRFVRLADMAGELGGFTSDQLAWLFGVAPLGFLVCCFWQGWSAPVIVDRKSFNRWLEAYGGAGVVRECLPPTMPQEDREFHVRIRGFGNPLSADHLESLRPQLDLHFSDEAIKRRFAEARIGFHPMDPIRTLAQVREDDKRRADARGVALN